jgi:hypothetical protein
MTISGGRRGYAFTLPSEDTDPSPDGAVRKRAYPGIKRWSCFELWMYQAI